MVPCIKSSIFYARRIYRGGGNCMNVSYWIVLWQAVSTIWAGLEVNVVAGHERSRTFPSANRAERVTCLFFSIKRWSSMTGALAVLKLLPRYLPLICCFGFKLAVKFIFVPDSFLFFFQIFVKTQLKIIHSELICVFIFFLVLCAHVKLSILLCECVAVCSYSPPGVWSVG